MRATPLAAALVLMTGACSPIFGKPNLSGPSAPPVACPPSLSAPIADEPIAPEGVKLDSLPPGAAEWFFADLLPWARMNATRLDQGKRWCATLGRPPDPG